jgi:tRNA(Ile)-lysidine synthase TilS/MesJ
VHFYLTQEPAPETVDYLRAFCAARKIPFAIRRVEHPQDESELNRIFYDVAIENQCQKVALPDSVDFLGATILTNMSLHGIFSGLSISDTVQMSPDLPKITFIRPCCMLTDSEIAKFGAENDCRNEPTGIRVEENPFMRVARQAIDHMQMDSNNVKLNVFNAQFHVQKKYVGASDHLTVEAEEDHGHYAD